MLLDLARARNKDYAPEINQVASNISRVVGDRMRGLIESGIISPITSAVVSASLRHVLDEVGLKEQVLLFFNDPEALERVKLAEAKKAEAERKKTEAEVKAKQAGFDLQLSGHTHGGQYFPFTLLIRFFHHYYKGLNNHDGMWIYINKGTGYWGPPLRVGSSPEISLITLKCKIA